MSHIREVPSPWSSFLSLEDTDPTTYVGQTGKFVRVNSSPNGLEFTDDVVQKTGSTMSGYLSLHADPTSAMHAVTKQYVDAVSIGLDFKESVRLATTAAGGNLDLNGAETIDGKATANGNRILVKNQTAPAENGIYVVAAGAWARAEDANVSAEVTAGMFCFVEDGDTQADTGWVLTTNNPITLGSTGLTFTQFSGPGTYTAGNGITITTFSIAADFENTDANIQPIGTQEAGDSNKVARANHVHAHGDQLGGTLHADVVAGGADGFMTGSDKTKLDGIATGAEVNQNAFSYVDINAAEHVLAADGKTDTLYLVEANVINIDSATEDTVTIGLSHGTEGQVIRMGATVPEWYTLGLGATTFLGLTDTPDDYTDDGGKRVVVNSTPDALIFEANTFVNMDDTPANYTDAANKILKVNTGGTAIEFVTGGIVPNTSTTGYTLYWNGTTWTASGILFNEHASAEVGVNTQAPNSTLHVEGSYSGKVYTTTATTYDLGSGTNGAINTLLCNPTSGQLTVTLPPVSGLGGRTYHIKKISATSSPTNDVVIDGNASETIDGATTYTLDIQYESVTLVCNGSAWYIV